MCVHRVSAERNRLTLVGHAQGPHKVATVPIICRLPTIGITF